MGTLTSEEAIGVPYFEQHHSGFLELDLVVPCLLIAV